MSDQRRSHALPAHPRVSVLGCFALKHDTTTVPLRVDARRLIAYLAVHPHLLPRAALAADLWPGVDLDAAARLLRDAVRAVDVPGLLDGVRQSDRPLALAADTVVDLAEAMHLVRALPERPVEEDTDLTLLAADILPGWTAGWIAVERERFRQLRLHALEERSLRCSAAGRYGEAVRVAELAVRSAPSRESARRVLIEAHLAEGEVAAAVAVYDEYQELLRSSVGGPASNLEDILSPAWPVLRVRRPVRGPSAQVLTGRRSTRPGRRLMSSGSAAR